ncbi:MAG: hypothetical protein IJO93_05580 [Clostridia bacterium]|nr:hypothetical protein [Clostridia bacterium]
MNEKITVKREHRRALCSFTGIYCSLIACVTWHMCLLCTVSCITAIICSVIGMRAKKVMAAFSIFLSLMSVTAMLVCRYLAS